MSNKLSDVNSDVSMTFQFTLFTAEEMQRWIDTGYFENHTDILSIAFGMVRNAVQQLENVKKVVKLHAVDIEIEVEVPNSIGHTLN